MDRVIGVDFDNTLVSYDEVMRRAALEEGLIPAGGGAGKREIRDRVRRLADGEQAWQKLQSLVYGLRMEEARLIDGVPEFFARCRQARIPVYIISHKTELAAWNATGVNLRHAALEWMERRRFFEPAGLGLAREHVCFESTRGEKIARIRALRCTHFIDDLEETFLEPSFPRDVAKILYAPSGHGTAIPGVTCVRSWQELDGHFFDDAP